MQSERIGKYDLLLITDDIDGVSAVDGPAGGYHCAPSTRALHGSVVQPRHRLPPVLHRPDHRYISAFLPGPLLPGKPGAASFKVLRQTSEPA